MSLRWKKEKAETGLRAIGSATRGFEYHDGEKVYAIVSPSGGGWRGEVEGWYWVAACGGDVPYKNTCNELCETPEEAKLQAQEYVKSHLKQSI